MSISKNSNTNQEILVKLAKLSTFKNWQNTLNAWLRTELTYTSNSLEGNTLSLVETSIIINDNQTVAGKSLREIYEARNHAFAFDFIQEKLILKITKNLTEKDFLEIHSLILKDIDDVNRGKYRNVPVRIAGSNSIFPNPLKVPDLMTAVFDWLQNIDFKEKENILKVAFLTHLKIVKIHPFTDGNCRTTRLFMNTILMQNGLPPLDILPENRKEYLEGLENSTAENPQSFIDFCLSQYNQNLDNYLETFN